MGKNHKNAGYQRDGYGDLEHPEPSAFKRNQEESSAVQIADNASPADESQRKSDGASEEITNPDLVGRGSSQSVQIYPDDDSLHEDEIGPDLDENEDHDSHLEKSEDTDAVSDIAEENAKAASSQPAAILDVTSANGDIPMENENKIGIHTVKCYRTQNLENPAIAKAIESGTYDIPKKATPGSSGYDISAFLIGSKFGLSRIIQPGDIVKIPTGFSFDIPSGFEFQVRPRSGLSLKGISVVNAPGTIDCDFKDEVQVILRNNGSTDFTINHGDRIAQLVFARVEPSELELGDIATRDLSEDRGGGFGSTGVAPLGADTEAK